MAGDSDMKKLGGLVVGLLFIMVVLPLAFIFGSQLQKNICVSIDGGVYNGNCWTNSDVNVSLQSDAFNSTGEVITAIKVILGFLSLIVLFFIMRLLLQSTKKLEV